VGSTGTDTYEPASSDPVLAGVRRLTLLADAAGGGEEIYRGLARELLHTPGAEEVHVHHLAHAPAPVPGPLSVLTAGVADELVDVYLAEGEGRLSYLAPRSERPGGVSWVASTGRPFLAAEARELAASLPRLTQSGPASCALLLPVAVRGDVQAVVVLVRRTLPDLYTERSIELASTLAEQAATALALVRARAEAGTDPVTGCMNHRAMRRRLHEEIGRAVRTGAPLSCMLLDLDNFKLVNDRDGHAAGDRVLREVGQALVGEFREFDRVARYGGDEFVAILSGAALEAAAAAASRALARLLALPVRETSPGVGASIGVAQWQAPMGPDALLQACDAALLRSKRTGKGRVTRATADS
jgi:diguanylate cyclase (GGDEF)-like protein